MSALRFPFTITDGSVQMSETTSAIAQSQIMFAVGTQVSERVMRPSFGIDITNTIWAVGGDLDDAVPEAIELVFTQNFPAYSVHDVHVTRDPNAPYNATVAVTYGTGTGLDAQVVTNLTLPASDTEGAI